MPARFRLSQGQLDQYFDRVCFPAARRLYDVSKLSDAEQLLFLNTLQKHQLVKVPWENLTQHYSWHRVVDVSPLHTFRKITQNPGRGGYCFEANTFFHAVLYSLNFHVYMAGSRIYQDEEHGFGAWTHIVNLVTIAGNKYLVDGGLGPLGPVDAFPLEADVDRDQVAPAQLRLRYDNISNNVDRSQRLWILEHRFHRDKGFEPVYCFTDLEFTPQDMVGLNLEPWKNPGTMFTYKVVAVRFTTNKESVESPGTPDEEAIEANIDGALSLSHDQLRWRRRGKDVLDLKFKKDSERVEALERYFGIVLAPEDREAIRGTGSEIGAFSH